jgi:hypothetical protein
MNTITPTPSDILPPFTDPLAPHEMAPLFPGEYDSLPSMPPLVCTHRSKGKIARLPKGTRDEINFMIRDGVPYPAIIEKLKERAQPEWLSISEQNLSNWKNGGHQHWLREQEWREDMRREWDEALAFATADDQTRLEQITLKIAALRLYQFFKSIEPAVFVAAAREKPEFFARLFSALPRMMRECLRLQHYNDESTRADHLAEH